ncbi:hypothetical protein N7524_011377 [Penicillium chrysogenum]|nr:hypothetical protein N7524_011377 [Penicillium chrysogenum]
MFVMLYDLEGEFNSVKFTYQAMKDTVPDTVTKDIFNSMCKKLIVERRDVPASSSTPNPQQMQPAITRTETSAVEEEDVDAVGKAAEEDHARSQITKEDAWRERVGSLPCSFASLALELTYSNGLLANTEREQLIAPKPADLETFVLHLVS